MREADREIVGDFADTVEANVDDFSTSLSFFSCIIWFFVFPFFFFFLFFLLLSSVLFCVHTNGTTQTLKILAWF